MLNREGMALLGAVINMHAELGELVKRGECKLIAFRLNFFMPADMQLSAQDVYDAIKDRNDFGGPKMNLEILRTRIDAMPVLHSARISGDIQAIVNELNLLPDVRVTVVDVDAAMKLRAVPKPTRVAAGSAALIGTSRIG